MSAPDREDQLIPIIIPFGQRIELDAKTFEPINPSLPIIYVKNMNRETVGFRIPLSRYVTQLRLYLHGRFDSHWREFVSARRWVVGIRNLASDWQPEEGDLLLLTDDGRAVRLQDELTLEAQGVTDGARILLAPRLR